MSAPASRRHAPAAERRAQILAAALRCFADKGYHAATMDDLVRESGLSKGSLYWHFEGKQDVFLGLFDLFAAQIFAGWEAAGEEGAETLDTLRRFAEIALEAVAGQQALLRAWAEFLSHPLARERMAEVYRESRRRLAAALRRGVARGEVRDVPAESAAVALTALIEGRLIQALVDPDLDPRAEFSTLWSLAQRSLAP